MEFYKLNNIFISNYLNIKLQNKQFFLDHNKELSTNFEIQIYQIALFHSKRLNIDLSNIYIEFMIKSKPNIHIQKIKSEKNKTYITPICSTITYLTEKYYPVIFTNINFDDYKYKKFNNEIHISFAEKNKHIVYDGSKFSGEINIYNEYENNENNILIINLYNIKPININYYDDNNFKLSSKKNTDTSEIQLLKNKLETQEIERPKVLILDTKIINYDFFEKLFYEKKK